MYDPVDMSTSIDDDDSTQIKSLVKHVVAVGGNSGYNVDYPAWPRRWSAIVRAPGNTTTTISTLPMNASHGAIGGTPGYHDSAEQDGSYTWSLDKGNSISADIEIRGALIGKNFGVKQLPYPWETAYGFPLNNPDNAGQPGNGPNN
jgi:hypothetical protein